jgi:diketogulonate reductase-like aldo/keto reductase
MRLTDFRLGQGTWGMGEDRARRTDEAAALRLGLDLGLGLIDTAEMYGEGGAEAVVADVIKGRRGEVCLVSKFYPHHATRQGVQDACDRSLRRLRTDFLDVYLLHWRGSTGFGETLEGLQRLKHSGKIREYGVSNLDTKEMTEWFAEPGGNGTATDQVLYNLSRRGIEWDLLPWCRDQRLPVMAYSPVEQGRILTKPVLKTIAARHKATPAQIALAWLLRHPDIIPIPKASTPEHVRENHAALDVALGRGDLEELDAAFPPPRRKVALQML